MVKFSREEVLAAHSAVSKRLALNMVPFVYYIDIGCLRWLVWNGLEFVATDELVATKTMLENAEQQESFLVALTLPLVYAGESCTNPQTATDDQINTAVSLLDAKRKATPTCRDYEREYRVVYWEASRRIDARRAGYKPKTVGPLPRDSVLPPKRKTGEKKKE